MLEELTSEQRVQSPYLSIDPGFINERLCFSTFGQRFHEAFEAHRHRGSDYLARLYNDHMLVNMALTMCRKANVRSLGEILANPERGTLFCSMQYVRGDTDLPRASGAAAHVEPGFDYDRTVTLELTLTHFTSDTIKSDFERGEQMIVLGAIHRVTPKTVVARPLIMGNPSYDDPQNDSFAVSRDSLVWLGSDYYQIFPEDIEEFRQIRAFPSPPTAAWQKVMAHLPERRIKEAFTSILGDVPTGDWGGEQADHFTSSVHLSGRRTTAAFVLKGPARFAPMTPDMLGKNADQIYRLAATPADLLVVQHCHDIEPSVRGTLRAFALVPPNPRHYCLIDGKDTYRILAAYGKLTAGSGQ